MVRVKIDELSFEECKDLARLTISTRKGTPLESSRGVDEIAKGIESLSTSDEYRILTVYENGSIVGWLYYYVAFPLMTFISGFYPVVDLRSKKFAHALIEAAKVDTVERDHSRLEIELELPSDSHRQHSRGIVDLYRECGFQFAAEEIHMNSDLSTIELPEIKQPQECILREFSEVPYDRLEGPAFQTLKDSKEGLFLSQSPPEQKVTIEYFFNKANPYIDDASLILERDGEVIGFIITRIGDDGEPDIGPVGLVPKARGQGLASFLLVKVLEILKDSGSTSVCLDTTITNHPAQKLYRKYGFEDEYYKQFYYWSP
ncbi:MAG: GNAT family N-acetyltransferase [Candidatus Thorarchaeota archaeon]